MLKNLIFVSLDSTSVNPSLKKLRITTNILLVWKARSFLSPSDELFGFITQFPVVIVNVNCFILVSLKINYNRYKEIKYNEQEWIGN